MTLPPPILPKFLAIPVWANLLPDRLHSHMLSFLHHSLPGSFSMQNLGRSASDSRCLKIIRFFLRGAVRVAPKLT